jgi:hypothetical protein
MELPAAESSAGSSWATAESSVARHGIRGTPGIFRRPGSHETPTLMTIVEEPQQRGAGRFTFFDGSSRRSPSGSERPGTVYSGSLRRSWYRGLHSRSRSHPRPESVPPIGTTFHQLRSDLIASSGITTLTSNGKKRFWPRRRSDQRQVHHHHPTWEAGRCASVHRSCGDLTQSDRTEARGPCRLSQNISR